VKQNWTVAKIEEITEVNPRLGKADIPSDLLVSFVPMPAVGAGNGAIDVSTVRPFSEVKKGFTCFQQGDVLFAKITPCMENGKMAVVPEVKNGYGFGSTEFHVLRPKAAINARYLYFYISSKQFRGEAEHQMTGAVGQKRVPTQFLRESTIPLAPLNEQTRLVAEIEKQFSRLDEAVANLKRVKANLKRYKAAVLKAAVEGKLTEEWRRGTACRAPTETGADLLQHILAERRKAAGKGKYKEPVAPDTSGLPELPAGWVWASVEQLSSVFGGLAKNPKRARLKLQLPYLRVANVYANELRLDEMEIIGVEEKELNKLLVKQGDLLIVEGNGSPEQIGRVAIWNGYIEPCVHQNHLIKVRLSSVCLPTFALYWLLSPSGRNLIRKVSSSTSGLYTLSVGKIGGLPLPLAPLAEQHQIVAEVERRLSIVAEAEVEVDNNLRRADRLRQSILKQAFSGQLVPQDPNDEPASVLLERIRGDVGARHAVPTVNTERPKRARHASPLRKPRQRIEPVGAIHELPLHLDGVLAAIIDRMQPGREYSRADLADPLGLSAGRWNAAIQELKRRGQVRQVGEKRGARYVLNNSIQ
jgi:type I restriction enzyme S subunit